MSKKTLLTLLLPLTILLASCGKEVQEGPKTNNNIEAENITYKPSFDGYTFNDSVLETPDYTLTIDKTQTGQAYNEDGLIIWFTLKNKSDSNIIPKDAFSNMLEVTQKDNTSVYTIPTDFNYLNVAEMLYPTSDKSIDDPEYITNNELQNKHNQEYDNKFFAELLPGKEIKTAVALTLETTDYPVSINIVEPFATELNTSPLNIDIN